MHEKKLDLDVNELLLCQQSKLQGRPVHKFQRKSIQITRIEISNIFETIQNTRIESSNIFSDDSIAMTVMNNSGTNKGWINRVHFI